MRRSSSGSKSPAWHISRPVRRRIPGDHERGVEALTTEVHVRYHRATYFDECSTVWVLRGDIRGSRCYEYRITRGDELVAEGCTQHVTVDRETYRPTRVPAWLAEAVTVGSPADRRFHGRLPAGRRLRGPSAWVSRRPARCGSALVRRVPALADQRAVLGVHSPRHGGPAGRAALLLDGRSTDRERSSLTRLTGIEPVISIVPSSSRRAGVHRRRSRTVMPSDSAKPFTSTHWIRVVHEPEIE